MKLRYRSTLLNDFILTTATSFLVSLVLIYIIYVLADNYSTEDMGAYLMIRRLAGFLSPLVLLGGAISVPRFVASSSTERDKVEYTWVGFVILFVLLSILLFLASIFYKYFHQLCFKDYKDSWIVWAMLIYLIGYSSKTVILGYYRGSIKMLSANSLNFLTDGLFPVCTIMVAIYLGWDIVTVVMVLSTGYLLYWVGFWHSKSSFVRFSKEKVSDLIRYGGPRAIDGLSNQGLMLVGPFIVQYFYGLKEAGIIIAGQIFLRLISTFFRPFGVVLLPRIAQLRSDKSQVEDRISDIISFVALFGVYVVSGLLVLTPSLVDLWLGQKYLEAIPVMYLVTLVLVPFLLFVMLKGVLDGYLDEPVVTKGLVLSLGVSAILTLIGALSDFSFNSIVLMSLSGFICLGMVVLYQVSKHFDIKWIGIDKVVLAIIFNLIIWGGIYYLLNMRDINTFGDYFSLFVAFGMNVLIYFSFLYYLQENWFISLLTKLKPNGTA